MVKAIKSFFFAIGSKFNDTGADVKLVESDGYWSGSEITPNFKSRKIDITHTNKRSPSNNFFFLILANRYMEGFLFLSAFSNL